MLQKFKGRVEVLMPLIVLGEHLLVDVCGDCDNERGTDGVEDLWVEVV